jgi:hypothetical protein
MVPASFAYSSYLEEAEMIGDLAHADQETFATRRKLRVDPLHATEDSRRCSATTPACATAQFYATKVQML